MGQPPIGWWWPPPVRGPCPFNAAGGAGTVHGVDSERSERQRPERQLAPDLPTQLEELLHQVWTEEEQWRREERIDLAVRRVRE